MKPTESSLSPDNATPHADIERRAEALLKSRFLAEAQSEHADERIAEELGDKLEAISHHDGERYARLRKLANQAAELWSQRKLLNRQQLIYLSAALLYFISPLDALPDLIPGLGYVDDIAVLSTVIAMVAKAVQQARERLSQKREEMIEDVTDRLVSKGQVALHQVVDERADELFTRFDRASADAVDNSVTTLVVSLWGMTTAAAVSLALAILFGGWSTTWMVYVGITTGLVLAWNIGVAVDYWRSYRKLSGAWQQRLRGIVAARIAWRHGIAIGVPVALLIALAALRLTLGSA
ncbi:MAG: YkvA family protein [Nevskiales bacterium]|nr:YkvA family protein [Nevskiales bacterium]